METGLITSPEGLLFGGVRKCNSVFLRGGVQSGEVAKTKYIPEEGTPSDGKRPRYEPRIEPAAKGLISDWSLGLFEFDQYFSDAPPTWNIDKVNNFRGTIG